MLLPIALLTWSGAGCRCPSIAVRSEIEYLKAGQPAPFDGYLLTPRLLTVLYADAERQAAEETVEQLRQKYGKE